ncbi:MAG: isochorismatase family protein [Planctomycetota bacterium]|nr:isochorismatase family protein [Planctomycetota bacterium]
MIILPFPLPAKIFIPTQSLVSYLFIATVVLALAAPKTSSASDPIIKTTRQSPVAGFQGQFHRIESVTTWNPLETALIICDVWDSHHCVNAVRRVQELAPRIESLATTLRASGATIIHAPSDCMPFYHSHPARDRAKATPTAANLPKDISTWCDRIPSEEAAAYPIDQSDGGEDDDPNDHQQWAEKLASEGRNPKAPWRQQIPTISINSDLDFISDSGNEIWNILESKGIRQIVICGVHTNMCVLGRPFGLRQLSVHGKNVALIRDLTDTMYNPLRWPYVNHFSGTDLIIDHVERYVCPTTTSDQIFRSLNSPTPAKYLTPFRFSTDRRPHLAILIAEDEYETAKTLPQFAAMHLNGQLRVSIIHGDSRDKSLIPGIDALSQADALLVSVRRRPLLESDLTTIKAFVQSGRPLVGIRTASHAFCLRDGKQAEGLVQWPEFDAYAFGGHYTNHFGNDLHPGIRRVESENRQFTSKGSLYQVSPLKSGTRVSHIGAIEGQPEEPVAWTYVRSDGGRSFYTSLGHPTDFAEPHFQELLLSAILDACGLERRSSDKISEDQLRYSTGKGRQRK